MSRRIVNALWLALLLFAMATTAAQTQEELPPPASPAAYRRALEEAYALLQKEPPAFEEAQQRLAAITRVSLKNGEILSVSSPLNGAETPADVEVARQRLRLVIAQLDAAVDDRTAERLATLERVFAAPGFQQRPSWLDPLRRWLAELFERLFARAPVGAAPGPFGQSAAQIAGWIVVALSGAVLLFLLTRWLQTMVRAFVEDVGRARQEADVLPATPAAARQAATRSAEQGAYRTAVRYLYLAALLTLQERRLIPRDPSLTNRELLTRAPAHHPIRAPLGEVVAVFDEVWYGLREPDFAAFQRYQHVVHELETLAQAGDVRQREAPS